MNTTLEHDDANTGPLTREKLEREIGKFGQAYGKGQNSRPAMALRCVEAAHRLMDVTPDDAEKLYTGFQQAAAKARGVEYSAEGSFKVQVSKLRQFLVLGSLQDVDGVTVMDETVGVIEDFSRQAENPLKGSAYDNMVNIARRQIAQPSQQLKVDDIKTILTEAKPEKTDLDKVIDLYKRVGAMANKLIEKGQNVDAMDLAIDAIAAQIQAMDPNAELPPLTESDKKKAKAIQTLKEQGLEVTVQAPAPVQAESDNVVAISTAAE